MIAVDPADTADRSGTADSAFEDCLSASGWIPDGPASPFSSDCD